MHPITIAMLATAKHEEIQRAAERARHVTAAERR